MKSLDLAKNNLRLCECKIFSEPFESLRDIEKIVREKFSYANFVAWQIQSVVWGKFDGNKFLLTDDSLPNFDDWLECRFFNEYEELHLKRAGENFVGRYVCDEQGDGDFYVDSFARLWGEHDENFSAEGRIKLEDKPRKLSMIIPCDDGGKKFYGLKTRNYIDSDDETGLSGYVDYRFVALEPAWDGD